MRLARMPSRPGHGRRFRNDSFTMEQIREFQALPADQRPAPPASHGMAVTLDQDDLEFRDPETGTWRVPTQALEGLAAFLHVSPPIRDGQTEGQRRHDLVHAIMREEKRVGRSPRAERWDRKEKDR